MRFESISEPKLRMNVGVTLMQQRFENPLFFGLFLPGLQVLGWHADMLNIIPAKLQHDTIVTVSISTCYRSFPWSLAAKAKKYWANSPKAREVTHSKLGVSFLCLPAP